MNKMYAKAQPNKKTPALRLEIAVSQCKKLLVSLRDYGFLSALTIFQACSYFMKYKLRFNSFRFSFYNPICLYQSSKFESAWQWFIELGEKKKFVTSSFDRGYSNCQIEVLKLR